MLNAESRCRQGPSEFCVTGRIKTWSIVDELHKVTIPVLIINGVYDEVMDIAMQPYFDKCQKVKWVKMPNSAHMGMWEERELFMKTVAGFLGDD